jgi:hypothetical protein
MIFWRRHMELMCGVVQEIWCLRMVPLALRGLLLQPVRLLLRQHRPALFRRHRRLNEAHESGPRFGPIYDFIGTENAAWPVCRSDGL